MKPQGNDSQRGRVTVVFLKPDLFQQCESREHTAGAQAPCQDAQQENTEARTGPVAEQSEPERLLPRCQLAADFVQGPAGSGRWLGCQLAQHLSLHARWQRLSEAILWATGRAPCTSGYLGRTAVAFKRWLSHLVPHGLHEEHEGSTVIPTFQRPSVMGHHELLGGRSFLSLAHFFRGLEMCSVFSFLNISESVLGSRLKGSHYSVPE